MEKYINVDIDPETGDFELNLENFKGKGCKDVAKFFEKAGKVKNEQLKPEFYDGSTKTTVKVGR